MTIKKELPPFHPFFQRSWTSKVWKQLVSPEARLVYLALCSKYRLGLDNNGKLNLSVRKGAEELGFNKNTITRCLRELVYYGFIAQTKAGQWHGIGVKGVAPGWRLTELSCKGEPPTFDFERFDGELFREHKSSRYHKRYKHYLATVEALSVLCAQQ
jgi:Helix-turn-helix domain